MSGKRLRKIHYYYSENDTNYEVDVFQEELQGLIAVDVEFSSNEEKARFVTPSWVLADVTQEKFIAGGMVCGKSYSDVQTGLERFGYRR